MKKKIVKELENKSKKLKGKAQKIVEDKLKTLKDNKTIVK